MWAVHTGMWYMGRGGGGGLGFKLCKISSFPEVKLWQPLFPFNQRESICNGVLTSEREAEWEAEKEGIIQKETDSEITDYIKHD